MVYSNIQRTPNEKLYLIWYIMSNISYLCYLVPMSDIMPENKHCTSLAKYSTLDVENCDRQAQMWEKEKHKWLTEAPFQSL